MTMIVGILLIVFGLDPRSGKLTSIDSKGNVINNNNKNNNYRSDDESNFIGLYDIDKTGKNKKERYNVTSLEYEQDDDKNMGNDYLFNKFSITDMAYGYN